MSGGPDQALAKDGMGAAERLPSGRHGLPADLVRERQRRRLLEAMVAAAGEDGYASTSVADVVGRSRISRATFYELFESKLDCFGAAHEMVADELVALAAGGCESGAPWPEKVVTALAKLCERLAADPAAARFFLIEPAAAGPAGERRRRAALDRFVPFFEQGYADAELGSRLSPRIGRAAVGAAASVIAGEVAAGRGIALGDRARDVAFAALVPFLGPERAAEDAKATKTPVSL